MHQRTVLKDIICHMATTNSDDTYKLLATQNKCHERSIIGVEFLRFSSNRRKFKLLTLAHDRLKLWNVSALDDDFDISENDKICAINFSCGAQSYDVVNNRKLMAVMGVESTLYRIEFDRNDEPAVESFNHGLMAMWFARISPDGELILTANFNGTLQLVDRTGAVVRTGAFEKAKLISAISYSPTGKYIVAANSQGWISVVSGTQLSNLYPIEGHYMKVRCITFVLDDQHILSGADDKTIKMYNLTETKGVLVRTFCGHQGSIMSISLDKASNCERFASAGTDNRIILWELSTGAKLHVLENKSTDFLRCVTFSPDGRFIVAGTDEATILAYRVPQPENYVEEPEDEEYENENEIDYNDTTIASQSFYAHKDYQNGSIDESDHISAYNTISTLHDSMALTVDQSADQTNGDGSPVPVEYQAGESTDEPVNYQEEFERRELEMQLGID
ncbi:WD repeat-containing protein 61 [Ditylenchus destructor]|uniref:WD repeat-containing protein 61 n=1 Tax=Ditylenchus destructor TaxID=166010 RepID=A0AAD4R391_9BILA|nr:WD repeat-containing protein 61 [Ditylenchus destructor]